MKPRRDKRGGKGKDGKMILAGRTHAVNREFVYIDFDDERFPSCWRSLLEPPKATFTKSRFPIPGKSAKIIVKTSI